MTFAAFTPFLATTASEVEVELAEGGAKKKLWKKEILPSGTRQYEGQVLDFSKINPACVDAFAKKAKDQVYFVLANPDNSHPKAGEEIKNLKGTMEKVELDVGGSLYGYFDFSGDPDMESTLRKSNGKFGVSARVEIDYTRKDTGNHFPYALTHVCGTTQPHIKGMGGWQAVELSEAENRMVVVDFSSQVEEVNTEMPVTKEDIEKLLGFKIDDLGTFVTEFKTAQEQINALGVGNPTNTAVTNTAVTTPAAPAELSDEQKKAITLAETQSKTALELAEKMQKDAAKATWTAKKSLFVRDGVPPAILDMAEPVMASHKAVTLDFSDGAGVSTTVDARDIVNKILDELKGTVDLSDTKGSQFHVIDPEDKGFASFASSFEDFTFPQANK